MFEGDCQAALFNLIVESDSKFLLALKCVFTSLVLLETIPCNIACSLSNGDFNSLLKKTLFVIICALG